MFLGDDERRHIENDVDHLIIWKVENEIVGHCIWHETSIEDYATESAEDKEVREILTQMLGVRYDIVELHEVWMQTKHRGKGWGKKFFEFFENFVRERKYSAIVYYTDNPSAIALCRKRRYEEMFLSSQGWHVFTKVV